MAKKPWPKAKALRKNAATAGQSPPQKLEVGSHSGPYFLIYITIVLYATYDIMSAAELCSGSVQWYC